MSRSSKVDEQFRDKLLIEIHASQAASNIQIVEIKDDLKAHMRRTHQNEVLIKQVEDKQSADINYVKKHIYYVQGALALLGIIGTILAALKYFK